ncbi:MAG: zinc ABC transporter substrate-binding protein [Chloroflexota bacterium]|nr:zinc ABC transporter substrate-binding protein [Chloroflexota bacterium]
MGRLVLLLLLLLVSIPVAQAQDAPLEIVTTTTQVTDLTTVLVGDLLGEQIVITALMGAGVDPHLYQPTESDVAAMSRADAVFYSGLFLEGRFGEVFNALGERSVLTYAVSQPVKDAGFTFGGFTLSEEFSDVDDPHFWFDPRNWQLAATGLAEQLALLDPANAETFADNAAAYVKQLDLLYAWGVEAMSVVPEEQRVLITSHDAFQYFGDAFGWEVRGLQGISTESEAGVADIEALADFIIERSIPVMFIESSVPPDAIEAVQEAVEAAGGSVGIGARELYSDAMGAPDEFGGIYIGMIATNIVTVVQGFGYEVAAFPMELGALPEELTGSASS